MVVGSWWSVPWCIGEDFNIVCFSSGRLAGGRFSPEMWDFSDFISEQGMLDLPLVGGRFTCSSNQDHPSMSRIDRFLLSTKWDTYLASSAKASCHACFWTTFPFS